MNKATSPAISRVWLMCPAMVARDPRQTVKKTAPINKVRCSLDIGNRCCFPLPSRSK